MLFANEFNWTFKINHCGSLLDLLFKKMLQRTTNQQTLLAIISIDVPMQAYETKQKLYFHSDTQSYNHIRHPSALAILGITQVGS